MTQTVIIEVFEIYLAVVNIVAFVLYGVDKHKAIQHQWRIPEATLILFAWIGGAAGALLGMNVFHHKTQKAKFRILVPLALVVWIVVLMYLSDRL